MATTITKINSGEGPQQGFTVISTTLNCQVDDNTKEKKIVPELPKELITEIMKYVVNIDANDALNCRLVSQAWKEAFDDCSDVMRKFVFHIPYTLTFLESTIVSKVKAVCFTEVFKGVLVDLEFFFKEIGHHIEEVTFAFNVDRTIAQIDQMKLMFSTLVAYSLNLKEMNVSTSCRNFLIPLSVQDHAHIRKSLTIFKINIEKLNMEDITLLNQFVISLPALSYLDLYAIYAVHNFGLQGSDHCMITIIDAHLQAHNTLKKVNTTNVNFRRNELFIYQPYMTAIKRNLDVDLTGVGGLDVSLNDLIMYASVHGVQVPSEHNTYLSIKKGQYTLREEESADNLKKIGCFVNLEKLHVIVTAGFRQQQGLSFLENLKKLQELVLRGPHKPSLTCILPRLRKLKICREFSCRRVYRDFSSCFPNLEELCLESICCVPSDFIYSLAKLEKLVSLDLCNCGLTDFDIYQLVDPLWADLTEPHIVKVPAISAFKSLKSLSFNMCAELTDSCLMNGIVYIKTLESFTLTWMRGMMFTNLGFRELGNGGRLKLTAKTENRLINVARFCSTTKETTYCNM